MDEWIAESQAVVAFACDRDLLCPNCRYNVKNIPEPRCPECGMQLGLALVAKGRRWLPPIIVMIAASAGVGLHLPLCVVIAIRYFIDGYRAKSAGEAFVMASIPGFTALALAVLCVVSLGRGKRWIERAAPKSRLTLALAIFGIELLVAFLQIYSGS